MEASVTLLEATTPVKLPAKRCTPPRGLAPGQTEGRISTTARRTLARPSRSLRPILHTACPGAALSCSKGSRGLFVPSRVIGIFTDTTIGTGQVSGCIRLLSYWHSPVFLLNSCLDLFSAPSLARRDPLSRSYRVSLPSSLTVIHPSASVCSTRPRVSVSVRVPAGWSLADFLGGLVTRAIGEPRRDPRTFRFGSEPGLSWTPQLLHP